MSYAMENAAVSKYVPAAGGIFLSAADTAAAAAESATDAAITAAAVSAANTALAAAAVSSARAVSAAILSESGIRSYAAAVHSRPASGRHARGAAGICESLPRSQTESAAAFPILRDTLTV